MALSPLEKAALDAFRHGVTRCVGARLVDLRLFGSRTRGEQRADSDLDVLVVVEGLTREERGRIIDAGADVSLETGLVLSPLVRGQGWLDGGSPLAREIQADGVTDPHRSVRAARVLTTAGLHADAVSRACYAVFHGAQALLASIGRAARTHDGVRNLVSEHFIRSGRLEAIHGRAFARAAADRGDADYDPDAVFSEEIAREAIATAEGFLAAVDTILASP